MTLDLVKLTRWIPTLGFLWWNLSDEDMTPTDMTMPMKIKNKVSQFVCLHNDTTKNWLLPNISLSNVIRKNIDDDRAWIHHEQDRFQGENPSKLNIHFISSLTQLHSEGHNSSIWSAINANEYMMESLFNKTSKPS